jgi:hypothetical protein
MNEIKKYQVTLKLAGLFLFLTIVIALVLVTTSPTVAGN